MHAVNANNISEVCAERQLQQKPDCELVARCPNRFDTQPLKATPTVINLMSHHSTAHITPGEQQTTPENRFSHVFSVWMY